METLASVRHGELSPRKMPLANSGGKRSDCGSAHEADVGLRDAAEVRERSDCSGGRGSLREFSVQRTRITFGCRPPRFAVLCTTHSESVDTLSTASEDALPC
jgi:hypothetical protein